MVELDINFYYLELIVLTFLISYLVYCFVVFLTAFDRTKRKQTKSLFPDGDGMRNEHKNNLSSTVATKQNDIQKDDNQQKSLDEKDISRVKTGADGLSLKVWCSKKEKKKGIFCRNLVHLEQQCREKFEITSEPKISFVCDNDGTEIVDDVYLMTLEPQTEIRVIQDGQRWSANQCHSDGSADDGLFDCGEVDENDDYDDESLSSNIDYDNCYFGGNDYLMVSTQSQSQNESVSTYLDNWLLQYKEKRMPFDVCQFLQELFVRKYLTDDSFINIKNCLEKDLMDINKTDIDCIENMFSMLKPRIGRVEYIYDVLSKIDGNLFAVNAKSIVGEIDGGTGFKSSEQTYHSLKRDSQNNKISSSSLSMFRQKFEKSLRRGNFDERRQLQMRKTGILKSILFVELDVEISRWNPVFQFGTDNGQHPKDALSKLFKTMQKWMKYVPCQNIAETGFLSRLAIAYAMTGQIDTANELIHRAYITAEFIPNCAEKWFMLHMYVMILLFDYEKTASVEALNKLTSIAENAIDRIQTGHDREITIFWVRMIKLRQVLANLGMSNKLKPIDSHDRNNTNLEDANKILQEIDEKSSEVKMEKRREMFFLVAKARICELENTKEKIELALELANLAVACDQKKGFGERKNVDLYIKTLEEKLKNYC